MTNKTGQNSVYDSGQRSTVVFLPGEERETKNIHSSIGINDHEHV